MTDAVWAEFNEVGWSRSNLCQLRIDLFPATSFQYFNLRNITDES